MRFNGQVGDLQAATNCVAARLHGQRWLGPRQQQQPAIGLGWKRFLEQRSHPAFGAGVARHHKAGQLGLAAMTGQSNGAVLAFFAVGIAQRITAI